MTAIDSADPDHVLGKGGVSIVAVEEAPGGAPSGKYRSLNNSILTVYAHAAAPASTMKVRSVVEDRKGKRKQDDAFREMQDGPRCAEAVFGLRHLDADVARQGRPSL